MGTKEKHVPMTPNADYQTAARAIHLRVMLAGSGGFQVREIDGKPGVLAVLPGDGSLARMHVDPPVHAGRLCYPSGKPLCVMLALNDPDPFSCYMHNVDAEIYRSQSNRMPYEVAKFADAVLFTSDPAVREVAEGLFADGRTLDFGDAAGPWSLPEACRPLLGAALASSDHALGHAATVLSEVAAGERPPSPYDDLESLIRWGEQADLMVRNADGVDAESLDVGDATWVRLHTRPGVKAEARALGFLEGHFLGPIAEVEDLFRPDRLNRPDAAKPRLIRDGREFWSLRGAGGERLAAAILGKDGTLTVRQHRSKAQEELPDAVNAAVCELRLHLGFGKGPAPR